MFYGKRTNYLIYERCLYIQKSGRILRFFFNDCLLNVKTHIIINHKTFDITRIYYTNVYSLIQNIMSNEDLKSTSIILISNDLFAF